MAHTMERSTHRLTVVGTAVGDRSSLISAFAHKGTEVQLRPAAGNEHVHSIAVWIRCNRFWGLWTTWAHIGFVVPDREDPWPPKLKAVAMRVVKAHVHSSYAPLEGERPKVVLHVVVESEPVADSVAASLD